MKEITQIILSNLSIKPLKGEGSQPAVLMGMAPADSLVQYKARDNEDRNIKILEMYKYFNTDSNGIISLKEEYAEKIQNSLNDIEVKSYLLCEREALEYIKKEHKNLYSFYSKMFTKYIITYNGDFPGVLYPRKHIVELYDKEITENVTKRLEKEMVIYEPTIDTSTIYEMNGNFAFSDDTLKEIEKMERKQGYTMNTTNLKLAIGLEFFADYQLHLLENWGKYNDFTLIGGRRIGKTYLLVYIALRELMIPGSTILYIAPDERLFLQAFMYIKRFMMKLSKYDKNLVVRETDYTVEDKKHLSIIRFIGGQSRHGVKASEAHLVIMDEAAYSPESVYLDVAIMATQNRRIGRGKIVNITTINTNTPKNRLYHEFVKGQLGEPGYYSMRVPILQSPFWGKKEVEDTISKYKNDERKTKTDIFAEFPDLNAKISEKSFFRTGKIAKEITSLFFDKKPLFINTNYINRNSVVSIGYDPAKKSSRIGIVVVSYFISQTGKEKCVVCGEGELPKGTGYIEQINYIQDITKYLKGLSSKVVLAMDENGVGATIYELLQATDMIIYPIHAVSNSYNLARQRGIVKNFVKKNEIYYVKYDYIQELPTRLQETNILTSVRLKNIFKDVVQINNTKDGEERKLQNKIDFWNALCLACFALVQIKPTIAYGGEFAKPINQNDKFLGSMIQNILENRSEKRSNASSSNFIY